MAPSVGNCSESTERFLSEHPEKALSMEKLDTPVSKPKSKSQWRDICSLIILLLANLLNYMDRYTIAGVLKDVQAFYGINDSQAGLLQISFIVSYMTLSPVFGYLGDRFNRRNLMAFGILFWSLVTLASSFIPESMFGLFVIMRVLVGVGEASYSTIAPTIIADLFINNKRSVALSVFYFAIPVGGGLGYIVGSKVAELMGQWQWALRVTFLPGILCTILIMALLKEPVRGAAEGICHCSDKVQCTCGGIKPKNAETSTLYKDLIYLLKNKSFVLSTAAFTCVTFVTGALAFWGPSYIHDSTCIQGKCVEPARIGLIFGGITCLAGIIGVSGGLVLAALLRKHTARADPLICGIGLILSAPFLFAALYIARENTLLTWIFIFIAEVCLCVNWALVTDILLYIIVPGRRSTAEAFQILFSHALGDAISPYLVGVMADHQRSQASNPEHFDLYVSRQYALYMNVFVAVIGGALFMATAAYVKNDRKRALQQMVQENSSDNDGSTSNDDVATNETINFITKNECGFGKIESQVTLTVELCESNEVTESKFSDNHSQDSGFSDVQGSENKSAELSERF